MSVPGAPVCVEDVGVPTNALLPATGTLVPTCLSPMRSISGESSARNPAPRGRVSLEFQGADFPSTVSEII